MSGCSVKTIHRNWLSIIAPFDAVSDSDGQLAIQKYIDQARMSLDGWGGDKEIRAFATMFQVDICVSNNSRGGRRWNYYPPLFYDEKNCRRKSIRKKATHKPFILFHATTRAADADHGVNIIITMWLIL